MTASLTVGLTQGVMTMQTKPQQLRVLAMSALLLATPLTVFAEAGSDGLTRGLTTTVADMTILDETNAIGITVIIPPTTPVSDVERIELTTPEPPQRRLFPTRVAEGYNEMGVRELIRVYELLSGENPEWINTESFERNGYYYQLAEITRQVDVNHTMREHTEWVAVPSETNDLARVIAGLEQVIEFTDEDGYMGLLHLDISTLDMTQDGTRQQSRRVTQQRTYPHLHTADLSLVPTTIEVGGRTYTLDDVQWSSQSTNPVDHTSVAQSFTATATYSRNAISNIATGYTTQVAYHGTLTRIAQGDARFVASFIGTPISDARRPSQTAQSPVVVVPGEREPNIDLDEENMGLLPYSPLETLEDDPEEEPVVITVPVTVVEPTVEETSADSEHVITGLLAGAIILLGSGVITGGAVWLAKKLAKTNTDLRNRNKKDLKNRIQDVIEDDRMAVEIAKEISDHELEGDDFEPSVDESYDPPYLDDGQEDDWSQQDEPDEPPADTSQDDDMGEERA